MARPGPSAAWLAVTVAVGPSLACGAKRPVDTERSEFADALRSMGAARVPEFVAIPEGTRLWSSRDAARDTLEGADAREVNSGPEVLMMPVISRQGGVLEVESGSARSPGAGACSSTIPGLDGFRLRLFVALDRVQPSACYPGRVEEPALSLRVRIEEDGFVVERGDETGRALGRETISLLDDRALLHDYSRFDYATLEAVAADLKERHPWETTVRISAQPKIPTQVFVFVVDALAGSGCRTDVASLWEAGGIPSECMFWHVIVEDEAEPGGQRGMERSR